MADSIEETGITGKVTTDIIRGKREAGVITTNNTDKKTLSPHNMGSMAKTPTIRGPVMATNNAVLSS